MLCCSCHFTYFGTPKSKKFKNFNFPDFSRSKKIPGILPNDSRYTYVICAAKNFAVFFGAKEVIREYEIVNLL